jgi:hypothetical protein
VAGRRAGSALVGTLARTRRENQENSASLLHSAPCEGENGPRRTRKDDRREGYGVWGGGGVAEAVSFAFFMATSGNVRLHLIAAAEVGVGVGMGVCVCVCVWAWCVWVGGWVGGCLCVRMYTHARTHTHTLSITHTHTFSLSLTHIRQGWRQDREDAQVSPTRV